MNLLLTYSTLLELHGHGVEPVLAVGQELVLPHLPTTWFSGITSSSFPGVWGDHLNRTIMTTKFTFLRTYLSQLAFLLTFVTNHGGFFI